MYQYDDPVGLENIVPMLNPILLLSSIFDPDLAGVQDLQAISNARHAIPCTMYGQFDGHD